MARALRIFSDTHPYHVTARCINREWFSLPMDFVWSVFSDQLHFVHHAYSARIHSFVLMNNHFHLIISTPLGNIDVIMRHLMTEVSRELSRAAGRINQTFGGPYYSSLITCHHYFLHAYKYVFRNPVDGGLVTHAHEYKYSTLSGVLGFNPLVIPVVEDTTLFSDFEGTLKWLDEDYKGEDRTKIRQALRYREFRLARDRVTRMRCPLETQLV